MYLRINVCEIIPRPAPGMYDLLRDNPRGTVNLALLGNPVGIYNKISKKSGSWILKVIGNRKLLLYRLASEHSIIC